MLWVDSDLASFNKVINDNPGQRIRQISVTTDASGANPRYTAIWQSRAAGEVVFQNAALSDADYQKALSNHPKMGVAPTTSCISTAVSASTRSCCRAP
jgi:hypothetical protein